MYILGAVLEKDRTKVALYDNNYKLVLKKESTCADISKLCIDVISDGGISTADVAYIGVAVDSSLSSLNVAADIGNNTGIKCFVTTLICAEALGEAYLSNDLPSLFMLRIDDTIESAIVIDKKIYSGMDQRAANVAHMVIDFGGYKCDCGNSGCFEACVSNSALKRIAADAGIADAENITHKTLFGMNSTDAVTAKKRYVEYLASAITDIINLFQPNELVLDGPICEVGEELMSPLMDIVLRKQYTRDNPNKCNIRLSNKVEDTELLGAALLSR